MLNGWQQISGSGYYLEANRPHDPWMAVCQRTLVLPNGDGVMLSPRWQYLGGRWYFLDGE